MAVDACGKQPAALKWALLATLVAVACQQQGGSPRLSQDEFLFDDQGREVEARLANRHRLEFGYDADDRLTRASFGQNNVRFGYEPGGNLRWTTDSGGTSEYYRDVLGRVNGIRWRHGADAWIQFRHDAWGRIYQVSVHGAASTRSALGEAATPPRDDAQWNERARLVTVGASRLDQVPPLYAVRYERDPQGRIVGIFTPAGRVGYAWKSNGHEVERTLPNGVRSVWAYSEAGQLLGLRHFSAAGETIAEYRYFYTGTGSLLRVEESASGRFSALEYRRDPIGHTCEAADAGDRTPAQACRTDALDRPLQAGGASLAWSHDGSLTERVAQGQTTRFAYDDRGLPVHAEGPNLDVGFEWDGNGQLTASRHNGRLRRYLTDPQYATGEPWIEFDAQGTPSVLRYCDSAAFLEIDAAEGQRYLLRDGFQNVRYVLSGTETIPSSASPPFAGRDLRVVDRWTTAPLTNGVSYAVYDTSPLALLRFLEQANSSQRGRLNAPETAARAYRALIRQQFDALLRYSGKGPLRLMLEPDGVDFAEAARHTRGTFRRRDGLSVPSSARALAPLLMPTLAAGFVMPERPASERVLDLPALFKAAAVAGKPLESITCLAACGGQLQRNLPALIRYAREGGPRPVIYLQTDYVGADTRDGLRVAGYRTLEWSVPAAVAQTREPVRDRRLGPLPVANVGRPPQFPVAAGPPSNSPPIGDEDVDLRRSIAGTDSDSADPASAGSAWVQLEDPYVLIREQAEQVESSAPGDLVARAGTLQGATWDAAGNRVSFVGDGVPSPSSATMADFAVALYLAYQPTAQYPSFTLDPADPADPRGPWLKPVYLPDAFLGATSFGNTMFQADWLMKQYSFGLAVGADNVIRDRRRLPGGLHDLFDLSAGREQHTEGDEWTRLWITPGDIQIRKSARAIQFDAFPMMIRVRRQVIDPHHPDGIRDDDGPVNPAHQRFADSFTAGYDQVAAASPVFGRVRELEKLVQTAHWLRDIGAPVDLEWAARTARNSGVVGPARVTALSSERSYLTYTGSTREKGEITRHYSKSTIRLFGGVSLEGRPRIVTDAEGQLNNIEARARRATPSRLGRPGEHARPADGPNRRNAVAQNGADTSEHRFDAQGRLSSSRLADATRIDYDWKPGNGVARIRITRGDGSLLERAPEPASRWTLQSASGRRFTYQYDGRGRLAEVTAGNQTVARLQYDGNIVSLESGPYRERLELDTLGRITTLERSGPGIAAGPESSSVKLAPQNAPVVPEGAPVLPSTATWTPGATRTEVEAARQSGFFTSARTTVRVTSTGGDAAMLLERPSCRLDAGRLTLDKPALAHLNAAEAPDKVVVLDAPSTARAVEKQYGDRTRVFFGTDAKLAATNAARMPVLDGPADVAIYLPPASAGIRDFHILRGIRDRLPGMRFVEDAAPVAEAKVVVITGHESPELAGYIEQMGRSGALANKLVLINSCHGALDAVGNARLIHEFEAVGVRSFTSEISPDALRDVVVRFHRLLASDALRGSTLEQVWRAAVEAISAEVDIPALRTEILRLLDAVTQVSRLHHRGVRDGIDA